MAWTDLSPGTVLLDAPRPDADSGRQGALLFTDPREVLLAQRYAEVADVLDRLDVALAAGHHVAGWLAYEAGYALEPSYLAERPRPDGPLAWFGVYDAPTPLDDATLAALLPPPEAAVRNARFALDRGAYADRIAQIKRHIAAGDVYQINLTAPVTFGTDATPLALFSALRARQQVAYGAVVRTEDLDVLSVSPELFFRVDISEGRRVITARPMKGTAPRGTTRDADDALADSLVASEKDQAENLMIVDLLRNDIGRVAEPGSVRVPALFEAERYQTVTQMTSTVQADLRPGARLADVMRALFPCGSVTGAPKLRAMQIIREIEAGPRGVYCGTIGFAAPGRGGLATAAFSVAIRTAVLREGTGRYDVGSGVVWDSRPDAEYEECLLKARVLTDLDPSGRDR